MKNNLNEDRLYNYIHECIEQNGYPPTVREICRELGFKSTSTAQYYLKKLEESNRITFGGKNRAISLTDKKTAHFIPVVGTVTAGQPVLAVENVESYYPLPEEFPYAEDMFMLRIRGTSMVNAGILNGDKVIVKKTTYCDDGDIIIALVEDCATCKRLFHRDGKVVLHPENDYMDDMIYDEVSVIGKVCGLIRKF